MSGLGQSERPTLKWYHPLLVAVQYCGPLAIVLQLFDSNSVASFFSMQLVRKLVFGIGGGAFLLYVFAGIALLRRRATSRSSN
jgi:hypothetical protein